MRDDERLDTGAPAKAGPIGISVRVLWLALILFGLYSIIFDWPTNARGGGLLVATGFTLLMFSEVFNLVFRRNWGYRPVQVLIALAVVALVVDLLVYGEVLGGAIDLAAMVCCPVRVRFSGRLLRCGDSYTTSWL